MFFFFYATGREHAPYALLGLIDTALEGWIHWVITQSYLRVAYETKFILDRGVLKNEPAKIDAVRRFKRNMLVANILCPLLILAFSVCIYFGYWTGNKFYYIGNYGWLSMIAIFTLTWGWTLFKLYRDTVHSKKLLPNKKIFILHGSLLVLFVLLEVLENYAYPRFLRAATPKG